MAKTLLVTLFIMIVMLNACSPTAMQIRQIVKEELTGIMTREPLLDAKTIGPYSPAQRVGNFLFVSGQIGLNPETGNMENKDIETETRQALENLMSILNLAEYESNDVISTTVYLKDIGDFSTMNNVYATFFQKGNYPTRATVQVAALPKDARVEISAIAFKTSKP